MDTGRVLSVNWLEALHLRFVLFEHDATWAAFGFETGHDLETALLDLLVLFLELLHLVETRLGFLLPVGLNLGTELGEAFVHHLDGKGRILVDLIVHMITLRRFLVCFSI
jgi:hypothetical protein